MRAKYPNLFRVALPSVAALLISASAASTAPTDYFKIQVVDAQTGRGVPLVELRTHNRVSWWTDSNGIVAFNEPGLMDRDVYFFVSSPGYEIGADAFGYRGVTLKTITGAHTEIRIKRLNIAERLYRITGQGIYRDSILAGHPVPLRQPVLNGQVMGQDTVIARPYRGKIYWFWGDTDKPDYPLGNFASSGATSEMPGGGGLDPSLGVDLTYFVGPSGFSKAMTPLKEEGLKWIQALYTVRDEQASERLAAWVGVFPGLARARSWHLMLFNDEKQVFESVRRWDRPEILDDPATAHPIEVTATGTNYYYTFSDWRVPADLKSLMDLRRYEAFNCLSGDGRWHDTQTKASRDASGRVQYSWKPGGDRLDSERLAKLIQQGALKPEEMWFYSLDFETGSPLTRGLGSVTWNQFRHRWIVFFARENGDCWFAEADTPTGPWGYARRVLTHGDYNFYNIMHHPFFQQEGGRLVYFEGTYTAAFTKAAENGTYTPRYNYNQLMYRLAMEDSRLTLPVAVYRVTATNGAGSFMLRDKVESSGSWERIQSVAWFALPPAAAPADLVAIYAQHQGSLVLSTNPPQPGMAPLFMALPLTDTTSGPTFEGLWNCQARDPDGEASIKFSLRLSLQGNTVRVGESGDAFTGTGLFKNGKLSLTLTETGESKTYSLQATVKGDTLEGDWRQNNGSENGTWSASLSEPSRPERRSPALVILRAYRKSGSGGYEYSIDDRPPPNCSPQGQPLCRVWKVPGSALALDWQTKPGVSATVSKSVSNRSP